MADSLCHGHKLTYTFLETMFRSKPMKMYAHQYQWNTIHVPVYAIQVIPLDDQICYVQWEFMNKY